MLPLLRRFQSSDAFDALVATARAGRPVQVDGVAAPARPILYASLYLATRRPLMIICPDDDSADRMHQSLVACLPDAPVRYFPSVEMAIYERYGVDPEAQADRLRALGELALGTMGVVVASGSSLLHDLTPRARFAELTRGVRVGDVVDRDDLLAWLDAAGYRRSDMVEDPGAFAARGGIVDVFPPTLTEPVRIEFYGDGVDSIRVFEPGSQRSTRMIASVTIGPATETLATAEERDSAAERLELLYRELAATLGPEARDRLARLVSEDADALRRGAHFAGIGYYHSLLFSERDSLLDYVPDDALVIVDEPLRVMRSCEEALAEFQDVHARRVARGELIALSGESVRQPDQLQEAIAARHPVLVTLLSPAIPWAGNRAHVSLECSPPEVFRGDFRALAERLREWQESGDTVVLATLQERRLLAILRERGVEHVEAYSSDCDLASGMVHVGGVPVQGGFVAPASRLVVLTDREVFGWPRPILPARRPRSEVTFTSLSELRVGDHVVHVAHGVGRYVGIVQDTVDGVVRDYLRIEYDGGTLSVPTTRIDRIQRYIGPEGESPALDSLSGATWSRKRKRAAKAAQDLAKDLLKLYAQRDRVEGHAFAEDQPWQYEVEAAFPYEETPDQLRAIEDTKADMESNRPMDRLICGDVGFGKTEVAVRAALKCVLDGKQAAVLVPTTILCEQHHRTFEERLGAYPLRIDKLSRFTSPSDVARILHGVATGRTDVVIGTHRLLSKDVRFSDLGLLIVDEEQRFGVVHKEALKRLRTNVDVLTLTATPIPRTLHMALSGIRDLSTINQAPSGRVAIRTFCVEEDDDVIREAILREMAREGQVYFVHNRVKSIAQWAQRIKKLVPQARIAVGHGQMADDDLEEVMLDFYAGDYDVLVCTSIIESGLDVPNVNTLIVQDAPAFGLAQLYQLRGRVGRSSRQAYAYFLYRSANRFSVEAEERLAAIREFTELGSGLRIAMRDLEIRGAGNLLGREQHGQIAAVGFELYCQLVREAVAQLRGCQPDGPEDLPPVDLPLDAYLPPSYVPSEGHRLDLYRRLSTVRDLERLADLRAEIVDRFGPMPDQAEHLLRVISFRIACRDHGIASVTEAAGATTLRVSPDMAVTKASHTQLRKYGMQEARRTIRAMVVKETWVSVTFANIGPPAKLAALEHIVGLIAVEKRLARAAP